MAWILRAAIVVCRLIHVRHGKIRLQPPIVPFTPGGSVDLVARPLAPKLSEETGSPWW
jgi:tripartite-type tricarboxylate transporter receptor subunit TctC